MTIGAKYDLKGKRIWVAGHRGMVGSAIVRRLAGEDCEILTATRAELDLAEQADVRAWVKDRKPDAIFVAAAKVGGILANSSFPADFIYDNLVLQQNIVEAAHRSGTGKVLFLGSSCIYPKLAPQPLVEDALLTGPLEPTNEWYALAKIAGIKLAEAFRRQYGSDFISAMPTNLYGPGDNYDLASSHVIPAIMRKVHTAKTRGTPLEIWGTGTPRREFLHVDDCADACVHLMTHYSDFQHVNIGSGEDLSILEMTRMVARIAGFTGEIVHDLSKPDGTPRKLMDVTKLARLGWRAKIPLEEGLASTYAWYAENVAPREAA